MEVLRSRHHSRRTEEAYIHWIRRFILFHSRAHPRELAEYEHVLEGPLDRIEGVVRARKPKRLPVVYRQWE